MKRIFILWIGILFLWSNSRALQRSANSGVTQQIFKHVLPRSQWIDYSPDRPERAVILDGEGGAIVVSQSLYEFLLIQKIDRYGNNIWADSGQGRLVALNTPPQDAQYAPILLSDGDGGAFLAYAYSEWKMADFGWWYNYDVYVQHFAREFARGWGDWGVAVAADDSITTEYPFGFVSDGVGGCIVLYSGPGKGPYATMYMQRLDQNGKFIWPDSGVKITENKEINHILADGKGGGFLISSIDYAQQFNNDAQLLWQLPYVHTGISLRRVWILRNNADIEKNIIVIGNTHNYKQIAAQKIFENSGKILWADSGRVWTPPDGQKIWPIITSNGKGGAFIFYKYLLQEVDSDGKYLYDPPVSILDTSLFKCLPNPVSGEFVEGQGAVILYISSDSHERYVKLLLQKIEIDHNLPWGPEGIEICTCESGEFLDLQQSLIKIDPAVNEAFVFVVFEEGIYVTKIDLATGGIVTEIKETPKNLPKNKHLQANPNPFNNQVIIRVNNPGPCSPTNIKIYNILGKEVIDLTSHFKNNQAQILWDGLDSSNRRVPSGLYFVQVKTTGAVYWQKITKTH